MSKQDILKQWKLSNGKQIADMVRGYWVKGSDSYQEALKIFGDENEKI